MGNTAGATGTTIIDIDPDDLRLGELYGVLHELRTELSLEKLRDVYAEGYPQGLRYTVVDAAGVIVAVAGWRLIACTTAGRRLYIDDLVTSANARSAGHGKLLIHELEARAKTAGCTTLTLESGVQRGAAHRFYFREGMTIGAYHFQLPL
jgi:GNAT superfamily N-acetyltransferase